MKHARLRRNALLGTCISSAVLVAACATGPASGEDDDAGRQQRDVPSFDAVVPGVSDSGGGAQDVASDGRAQEEVTDSDASDAAEDAALDADAPLDGSAGDAGGDTAVTPDTAPVDTGTPDATEADTSGEHACVTSPEVCAPGPGNECCMASCDTVAGCSTSPGSCGGTDECTDPHRLTVGRTCTGCGPANAAGICGGETVAVCNAEQQTPCQEVACGGATFVCTNAGGVWRWRASSACDDGDACTFGDTCRAGLCAGTAIECASTTCIDRTCNGTSTCTETARTGLSCDDGDACTTGTTCDTGGMCGGGTPSTTCGDGMCACGETLASCPADCAPTLPTNACTNGVESRSGCGNARTISRAAAAAGWSSGTQQTCDASNRHDDDCPGFDVGNDHTYALFLRAGERVVAELATVDNDCEWGDEFNSYLKFRFHADPSAAGATSCPGFEMCAGGPRVYERWTTVRDYIAAEDGWLFVIVDGGASAWDEHRGYYELSVELSRCDDAECGC